jgi:hypothetical protein
MTFEWDWTGKPSENSFKYHTNIRKEGLGILMNSSVNVGFEPGISRIRSTTLDSHVTLLEHYSDSSDSVSRPCFLRQVKAKLFSYINSQTSVPFTCSIQLPNLSFVCKFCQINNSPCAFPEISRGVWTSKHQSLHTVLQLSLKVQK